mgnify:CR=1 FL=1
MAGDKKGRRRRTPEAGREALPFSPARELRKEFNYVLQLDNDDALVLRKYQQLLSQGAANFARGLWGRDRARAPLYERAAARLPLAAIEAALMALAGIDRQAKGLDRVADPWDTLLQLGLSWGQAGKR